MLIHGFAYSKTELEEGDRRNKVVQRLNELNFMNFVTVTKSIPEYAQHKYSGIVSSDFVHPFTDEDLLIWLDGWCLAPFGGSIDYDRRSGKFDAVVYTD